MNIFLRMKRLWDISGINVDGFEFETERKQIINQLTDILRPSKQAESKNLDKYNDEWKKHHV